MALYRKIRRIKRQIVSFVGTVRMESPMKAPLKMGPSEALVETLAAQGVTHVFGIVGSAYMDALDLFPLAGIRFISVAHEQGGGHMADGYSRVSGKPMHPHRGSSRFGCSPFRRDDYSSVRGKSGNGR